MHEDIRYLLLVDRAVPYLLARVRWPDVAQAISPASPDWLDDPGLFDLPYDRAALPVSFEQAVSVAAAWGTQLHPDPVVGAPSYIRRMPADWSHLSPSERRTWGLESVGRLRAPSRRIRRAAGSLAAGQAERRSDVRVRLGGRAYIRHGNETVSVGVLDVSRGGARCVLPETPLVLDSERPALGTPFLLEADADDSRICLDVAGTVGWTKSTEDGTQFGIAFGELAQDEADGMRRFLAHASRSRAAA